MRALKRFGSEESAVAYAQKICEKDGSNLYVRREGGGIKRMYEYRRT